MKKYFVLLALVLISIVTNAQIKGKCKKSNPFNQVQIYDGIIVTLERSEENMLCPGADTDLKNLQITINEGVLRIRKISGKKYEDTPKLKVKYASLVKIEAYGKADLDAPKLILSDSLEIILKSGSRLYGSCDVKHLKVNVAEGSLLKIDGYAISQDIRSTGKATFSGFELIGETAKLKATTGGTIKINAEKSIQGISNSGGYIAYIGSPQLDVKTNTGGKLVASGE